MTNSILPLANWGAGTAIIIFFAVLCVVMSAIVISFVLSGKKKDSNDEVFPKKENSLE
ncbi:hypothetical protein [Aequorivita viscosa]|uniref:Uncharacterized protein n=1 Tax=Aequorivita viscosa TaxID=797419 RepID=A0A1M6GX25_9FLAO|nr:hypothetical protein [Aequorivita viscosa]SDW79507.1 hypothetical protein SAMN05216556_11058 [Aequorivita viscosa]SHJ14467.1 hypothetical protein SAMN04487908_11042 [Aequorivita viscosa]